jgi:hypothetical protein
VIEITPKSLKILKFPKFNFVNWLVSMVYRLKNGHKIVLLSGE